MVPGVVQAQNADPLSFLPLASDSLNDLNDTIPDNTLLLDISDARAEFFVIGRPFEFNSPDSGIERMQDYDPAFRGFADRQTLGNIGQASQPLIFGPRGSVGLDMAEEPYKPYQSQADSLAYFRVNMPYTRIRYLLGAGVQQRLRFTHSQNLMPNLNLGLDYTRTVSEGQSLQQKAGLHDLGVSGWYRSRDHRYAATLSYLFFSALAQENGGAAIDSVFDFTPRSAAPIVLADAFSRQRRHSINLGNHLFGGRMTLSEPDDSTSLQRVEPSWRAWHRLSWISDRREFTDALPDQDNYPPFLFFSDSLQVSYGLQRLENELGWGSSGLVRADSSLRTFQYKATLMHRVDALQQTIERNTVQDLIGGAVLSLVPQSDSLRRWSLIGRGEGSISLSGEFDASVRAGFATPEQRLTLGIGAMRLKPSEQQNLFFSQAWFWDQDLAAEYRVVPEFRYRHRAARLDLALKYHRVQRMIYWDESSVPRNAGAGTDVLQLLLQQNFRLGNWHLDNAIALQRSTAEWINLPLYMGRHSFYYEDSFFEGALFARFGFDMRFQSRYTADAWNPVTASFYVQNQITPDTYPVVDLFFNAIIDQARIFVKVYNINQGYPEAGYYQTPNYPMMNRGFVFGIDWRFWY